MCKGKSNKRANTREQSTYGNIRRVVRVEPFEDICFTQGDLLSKDDIHKHTHPSEFGVFKKKKK